MCMYLVLPYAQTHIPNHLRGCASFEALTHASFHCCHSPSILDSLTWTPQLFPDVLSKMPFLFYKIHA